MKQLAEWLVDCSRCLEWTLDSGKFVVPSAALIMDRSQQTADIMRHLAVCGMRIHQGL